MNKFRLKDGKSLTLYAFACGYVQKAVSPDTIPYRVVICNPPFDSERPKVELSLYHDGCFRECIADARKKFKELKRIHNLTW